MGNLLFQREREDSNWSDSSDEGSPWLTKEDRQRLLEERQRILEERQRILEEYPWLTTENRQLVLEVSRELLQQRQRLLEGSLWLTKEERQRLLEVSRRRVELYDDIRSRGPMATLAYQNALEAGRVQVYRAQVMLIGQDRAGKTSLKKSFLGLPFDPDEQSTDGVEVDPPSLEIKVEQVQNWKRIYEKPGVSLFGKHLLKIMAEELDEEMKKSVGYVLEKPKEKTSEQDKVVTLE